MRSASDVLDAINGLELAFPVHKWRTADIDLWPVYRIHLFMNATLAILGNCPLPTRLQRLPALADRAARSLWRVPLAAWSDRRANAALRPDTAAVFLSDGVSFIRLGGKWFDRVVDPIMQILDQRGLHSLKLTPLGEAHVPRHRPSRFVQPAIDRVKLLASLHRPALEVPQFDAFEGAARATFGRHAPAREWLQLQAARLVALAHWFASPLERCGASHAFVNTYYSLEGQAFTQAARRLGLCSVDLQHGLQGQQHAAYGRWAAVPVEGYSTLPDEFWVWGDEEAAAINAWSRATMTHRPRVTGNYWLQHWRDDADPLVADNLAAARALRAPAPAVAQVLVNLTWGVADEETDKIIEAAKLCGAPMAWWWRLHPVESSRRAEFAARLERHGLDASRVGAATDMPLYALVRSADLTVAHSSTVIQEAAELGVSSVVTSNYGAELHAELVRSGVVWRATDARAIADAVMALALRPRPAGSTASAGAGLLHDAVDDAFQHPRLARAPVKAATA